MHHYQQYSLLSLKLPKISQILSAYFFTIWVLFYFLILQLLIPVTSRGQSVDGVPGTVNISSPNAASLGKFVDIPVDNFTGTAQMSIPIYTIHEGSLSLPLSLSYHASGLKVQEVASWVGAGWALNAGGVITRTVMGLPDDYSEGNAQTKGYYSDYGYYSYLYEGGSSTADDAGFADGRLDGEPDIFFFNFNGITGKFYFNDDRTPMLVPEQDLRIEVGTTGIGRRIEGFTLTTSDGTKYYFGRNGNGSGEPPIESTIVFSAQFGMESSRPVSSWFLNKIESPDGRFSIKLVYEEEKYSYYTIATPTLKWTDLPPYNGETKDAWLVKNNVQGVRLKQINFSDGTISFISSTNNRSDLAKYDPSSILEHANDQAKALQEIQIKGKAGSPCRTLSFFNSYFFDSTTTNPVTHDGNNLIESDKRRLRLDSIQERSCDGSITGGSYTFHYYSGKVPRNLSFGRDYWGFYNGVDNNSTIIPTYMEDISVVPGADRAPHWPEMRNGSLQKVTFPTGGKTTFEYEPHDTYTTYTKLVTTSSDIWLGFDGNATVSNPYFLTVVSEGKGGNVKMNNTSPYFDAILRIFDSLHHPMPIAINVAKNTPVEKNFSFSLPKGTYTVELSFNAGPSDNNPTGTGATAHFYEVHSVGVNKNSMVGGLRIKSIIRETTDSTNRMVTTYDYYREDGKSSGELYSRPAFVSVARNDILKLLKGNGPFGGIGCSPNGCAACETSSSLQPYTKSGADIRPMSSLQGYHMGYTQVTVQQTGNGKSTYNYYGSKYQWYPYMKNPPGDVAVLEVDTKVCNPDLPNYPTVPLPFEYVKGELAGELHFNKEGKLLNSKYYTYSFEENPMFTPAYIAVRNPALWGSTYNLGTSRKTGTQVEEVTYTEFGNDTVYSAMLNQSSFHHQTTKVVAVSSIGDTIKTQLKYSFDYRIPACDAIDNGLKQYSLEDSTVEALFKAALALEDVNNTNNRWNDFQIYRKSKADARKSFIAYRRENFSDSGNTFKTMHDLAKGNANFELKSLLQMQDNFQNLPIESTIWKDGHLSKSTYTTFGLSDIPSAVYPIKRETIPLESPTITFEESRLNGNDIFKDSRYEWEDTARYANGRIVELISRKDPPVVYLWGYNGQYPVVKTMGCDYNTIIQHLSQSQIDNATSIPNNDAAVKTLLDGLRSAFTGNSKVQVWTYIYGPLEGMTSETDPKGNTTFYDFDSFGRLKDEKDNAGNVFRKYDYHYQNK